jgi:leucyl aminopeptidase
VDPELVKIETMTGDPLVHPAMGLVVGVFDDGRVVGDLKKKIDAALSGEFSRILDEGVFRGERGDVMILPTLGKMSPQNLVLAGLGNRDSLTTEGLRRVSGQVAKAASKRRIKTLLSTLSGALKDVALSSEAVVEGTLLALYRFDTYKTAGKDKHEPKVPAQPLEALWLASSKEGEKKQGRGISVAKAVVRGVYLARDLGNHPANVATPSMISETAAKEAAARKISFVSYDFQTISQMGLGALAGVAKGSLEPARLIRLEYKPKKAINKNPVLLVGKTLTFDSGGISLKPAEKMEAMKGDMSGGAAVLGTMMACADLDIPLHIVGIMPATENMPSGTANKPGDVLTAFNGKTIEVINTDAEGRLILADALSWGIKTFHPELTIDLATLTGAVTVALGSHAIGVLGNNRDLVARALEAREVSGERGWELPLFEEYYEQIKSPIADMQNVGGRGAGTITAAAFLSHFVDDCPWLHLDIAGTAWVESDEPYKPKGNVGVGIRLLVHLLDGLVEKEWKDPRGAKASKKSSKK